MKEEWVTYRRYNDIALAKETAQALTENGIPNTVVDGTKYFDVSFANNSFAADIHLKMLPANFDKADNLLESLFKLSLDDVDKDYYLCSFTDQELTAIITKPDEWGQFDYQLAQQLLQQRGKTVDSNEVQLLKLNRLVELAEPEPVKGIWIVIGYAASFVGALTGILGGFVGIIAGWALAFSKKTLPDGQRVFVYDEHSRKHGKGMIVIGAVIFIFRVGFSIWFLLR